MSLTLIIDCFSLSFAVFFYYYYYCLLFRLHRNSLKTYREEMILLKSRSEAELYKALSILQHRSHLKNTFPTSLNKIGTLVIYGYYTSVTSRINTNK